MKRALNIIFGTLLISAFLFSSCSPDEAKEKEQKKTNKQLSTKTEQPTTESNTITTVLPSPFQIAYLFKQAQLEFEDGVINDTEKASQYLTHKAALLNLGVYSADFTYCALNEKAEEAKTLLKAIEELSNNIGFASGLNKENNLKRFEDNIENLDSIAAIISELQMEINSYNFDDEEQHKATLIFSGAWIESMFLGTKTKELSSNPDLLDLVFEQEELLDLLIQLLEEAKDDNLKEDIYWTLAALTKIKEAYAPMSTYNEEGQLEITRAQLENLSNTIIEVRTTVVEELSI